MDKNNSLAPTVDGLAQPLTLEVRRSKKIRTGIKAGEIDTMACSARSRMQRN